jgi:hypothetical protein
MIGYLLQMVNLVSENKQLKILPLKLFDLLLEMHKQLYMQLIQSFQN